MAAILPTFGDLDPELASYDRAEAVILPVPFERTTSYGKGTASGPRALLAASRYLELYDEELEREPSDQGIHTLEAFVPGAADLAEAIGELEEEAAKHLAAGKFLLTVGGEHSLSLAPVRAAARRFRDLGVVQFDAHADLRATYEGTPYSHACVMRRILDLGMPTLAVGIRSLSGREAQLVRERGLPVLWGQELEQPGTEDRFASLLAALPESVYLTFDIDFFDPSLVPATGTPEPGGGRWYPTLRCLRHLFESKRVVAMDVVELAPITGQPGSDFLAAKLAYKCLGYRWAAGRDSGS